MKLLNSRAVLAVVAALMLIVPAYCAFALDMFEPHVSGSMEKSLTIVDKKGGKHSFNVELAITDTQQEQGLMFVKEMPVNAGMLFVFRTVEPRTFWMKNTLIPLDMLFVEEDGRIQHIHSMAKPQDTSMITSGKPCKAVLEINGGQADALGLDEGDVIYHSAFNNVNLLPKD